MFRGIARALPPGTRSMICRREKTFPQDNARWPAFIWEDLLPGRRIIFGQ